MSLPQLLDTKTLNAVVVRQAINEATSATTLSKVFTGTDETAATPSKIGDIFVKNNGSLYVAKSTNPATGWVALDIT
jgi:hypothetical protein